MEVKTKRFIIRYNEGMVNVPAKNTEEAIAEFKKLGIETTAKEITIISEEDMFKRRSEIIAKE